MRQSIRLLLVPVTAVLLLFSLVGPPAASARPYCGIWWGSLAKVTTGSAVAAPIITDVRAGRHACYERLVVDLSGPLEASHVRYVRTVRSGGAGMPASLRGGAKLRILVRAPTHDDTYTPVYQPANPAEIVPVAGYRTFRQVRDVGSYEGTTTFGLGVRARLPFRVFQLSGPGDGSRLVIDVAHRWAAPAATEDPAVVQTVMDERAKASTGKAKVRAPGLENLDFDIRRNKTVVTKAGSSTVIASRDNPYPRKAFGLRPGIYRFKTTIKYRTPTYQGSGTRWSEAKTVKRTQLVKVLKPAAGTCIYMVKNTEELGEPGDRFMIWHKVHRIVHGIRGAFQSEYSDLRLKFNTKRTKASGFVFLYPTGEKVAQAFKVKGSSNKSYAAKGWYRVSTSAWNSQYPQKSTPHC